LPAIEHLASSADGVAACAGGKKRRKAMVGAEGPDTFVEATPDRAARGAGEHAVDAPQHGWPHVWLQAGKSKRRRHEGKRGLSSHVSETECLAATAAAHARAQQADAYEMAKEMKTVFMAKKKVLGAKAGARVPRVISARARQFAGSRAWGAVLLVRAGWHCNIKKRRRRRRRALIAELASFDRLPPCGGYYFSF